MTGESAEPMQVDEPAQDAVGRAGVAARALDNANTTDGRNQNFIIHQPNIDLEAYIQGYSGPLRIHRLLFIAEHCPSLAVEALLMALTFVKETHNTQLYLHLYKKLVDAAKGGPASDTPSTAGRSQALPDVASNGRGNVEIPPLDQAWVDQKNKKAALKLEKLDTDFKNYKSNSIKESIRRGHDDLGDHYLDCGDLSNALKCYTRARDYCTSGAHVVRMCLNVIKVSAYQTNWQHVLTYVAKAFATPDFNDSYGKDPADHLVMTRLRCARGLACLGLEEYKDAAKYFLCAILDYCEIPDLMTPQNVAVYGSLCALATFSRDDLKNLVISSSTFKLFLELDPQIREVIHSFHDAKYATALALLSQMRDTFMLDMFLSPHVTALYAMIRKAGLVQYFQPFTTACLRRMAASFNTTVPALIEELIELIESGQIKGRIDSVNQVLIEEKIEKRNKVYEMAKELGEYYQRKSKMLIFRQALLRHGVTVKPESSQQGQQSGQSQQQGMEQEQAMAQQE